MKLHKPKAQDYTLGWVGFGLSLATCLGCLVLGICFFLDAAGSRNTENVLLTTVPNIFFGLVFCAISSLVSYYMFIEPNDSQEENLLRRH